MKKTILFLQSFIFLLPIYCFAVPQSIHLEWSFNGQPDVEKRQQGFRLYQEGSRICDTMTPSAQSMDCNFSSDNGTYSFTLTALYDDGTESPHSPPFLFRLGEDPVQNPTPNTNPPIAVISASISLGSSPLNVAFRGSQSNPDAQPVVSYQWDFGDGTHGVGANVDHIYTAVGIFHTTLNITDDQGHTNQTSTPVIVVEGTTNLRISATNLPPSTAQEIIEPTDSSTPPLITNNEENNTQDTNSDPTQNASETPSPSTVEPAVTSNNSGDDSTTPSVIPSVVPAQSTTRPVDDNNNNSNSNPTHIATVVPAQSTTRPVDDNNNNSNSNPTHIATVVPAQSTTRPVDDNNNNSNSNPTHIATVVPAQSTTRPVDDNNNNSNSNPTHIATVVPAQSTTRPVDDNNNNSNSNPTHIATVVPAQSTTRPVDDNNNNSNSNPTHIATVVPAQSTTTPVDDNNNNGNSNPTTDVAATLPAQNTSDSVVPPIEDTPQHSTVNNTPVATISSSVTLGTSPFDVTFRGDQSNPDGQPVAHYEWNFGDGTQAVGKNATHTYTTAGIFHAMLTIVDEQGLTNQTSTPIIVIQGINATSSPEIATSPISNLTIASTQSRTDRSQPAKMTPQDTTTNSNFNIEIGEIDVAGNWTRILFNDQFTRPVVVVGPPSYSDTHPCIIRLRNIDSTGFEIRLQEWDQRDESHESETVSYMVMEHGKYTLENGSQIEAGIFNGDTDYQVNSFTQNFTVPPVLMTSITTFNESDTVTGRVKDVSTTEFSYKMSEQNHSISSHTTESVNFIAWEPGYATIGDVEYNIETTNSTIVSNWYPIETIVNTSQTPLVMAAMQTQHGSDTASLRYTKDLLQNIDIKIEEKQESANEDQTSRETVGYFTFSRRTYPLASATE